jgi:hypothetical protein
LCVSGVTPTCPIFLLHVTWVVVVCVEPQLSTELSAFDYLKSRRYFCLVCIMLAAGFTGRTHPRLIVEIHKELCFFIEESIENKVHNDTVYKKAHLHRVFRDSKHYILISSLLPVHFIKLGTLCLVVKSSI